MKVRNRFNDEIIGEFEISPKADLFRANLSVANLSGANLCGADLFRANLSDANLCGADLFRANLSDANLSDANLSEANLSVANLSGANLSDANLSDANLFRADLSDANLSDANLSEAYLFRANLSDANLCGADLSEANLSETKGIPIAKKYMDQFEKDNKGWIVYKAIGNTYYSPSNNWKMEENSFLEETVNKTVTNLCGCGVNFATLEWIKKEFDNCSEIWKCRIWFEDGVDVVVPYNTDGKARCGRLQLLEKIK